MTCDSCGADIRSCRNCRFWSPGSYHDCDERVEDAVTNKERANFCDSFQLEPSFRKEHPVPGKGGAGKTDASSAAKSAFDGLFSQ